MPRTAKKTWYKLAVAISALVTAILLAAFALPQQILCVDSGDVRADAIVVLGGGSYERPQRAAELFREHAAPAIVLTGSGDCQANKKLLTAAGVAAEAIETECESRSTRENALFTAPLLHKLGARRVILVTSWYHSRRALRCFRHYVPEIQFYSRPAYFAYPRSQWPRQGMRGYIRAEYVKLVGYWVCYGVCPF
jgi:uncharacterized SAM-binding protein YcdF (DUF218 family)